jgi:hypothetical protein
VEAANRRDAGWVGGWAVKAVWSMEVGDLIADLGRDATNRRIVIGIWLNGPFGVGRESFERKDLDFCG